MQYDISMVICFIVAFIIVVTMIAYQRMDKHRYMAIRYIQSMDEDIRAWLDAAIKLLELDCADDEPFKKYRALMKRYDSVKRRCAHQRAEIINQLHALVRDTAVEHFDYPGVRDICVDLTNKARIFEDMCYEYNEYTAKLNTNLDKPVGGLVGKIFRIKKLVRLDDLSIP